MKLIGFILKMLHKLQTKKAAFDNFSDQAQLSVDFR